MQIIPANKANNDVLLFTDNLLYLNSEYPTNRLKAPHKTLIKGDEFPKPGGFANGDGNGFPEMPLT
ncbi:MAG: hypothetical protein M0Q26_02140 [Chitinophagaceae bacterium]|nr:hypothetical protein [Chitinophagaceae bacterium]MDP1810388.1 hypothetical protein [Sediminibacterium sp.]